MRTAIAIAGILTCIIPLTRPARAQVESSAEELAPQREVMGFWWLDTLATGATTYSSGSSAQPGGEVGLVLHAEEDGGFARSFLFSWLSLDARGRLGAGAQDTGAGVNLRAESRVLQWRFMNNEGQIYELLPLDMYAELDYRAIPSLSSRRELWRRPYSRQVVGGSLSFGDMMGKGWDFVRVAMEVSKLSQTDELGVFRHRQIGFDATFVMHHRARLDGGPDFHADIVRFGATGIQAPVGPDASVGFVDLLRVSGLKLPGGVLFADLAGGFAGTGTMTISGSNGDDTWSTTIDTENLPNTGSWTGRARVYGSLPDIGFGLEAEKALYLTVDVELAIEARLAAYAEWRNRHGALTVRGFASRNKLWLDRETSETTTTGGVFASFQRPVGRDLSVIASVEVARSFYADLRDAGDLRPESAMGANTFITLAKHFGRDWRERRFAGL